MHSPSEQKRIKCEKEFAENTMRKGEGSTKAILHAVSIRYGSDGGTSIATTLSTTLGYIISPGINAPAQQQTGSADDEPPEQEHDAHPRKREIVEKMAELIAQAKALGEMTEMAGEMADMLEEMSWQLNETAAELLELTKLPGV
ncbi:Chemotaxis protein [Lasiodiplodia theobromae]|uniref:Chemotaxis protein n=1 Tax=Lasiodiplodia theobromae TaxID=45133 RepID=UPI0015C3D7D1|nr:Chemotaxis protein [Lasiodiplodia theobromae]KAF4534704.1 Chemotaxis protein [Lasiodiplodia theobromae]